MFPVLRAVDALGGSATNREIEATVIEQQGFTDEQLAIRVLIEQVRMHRPGRFVAWVTLRTGGGDP